MDRCSWVGVGKEIWWYILDCQDTHTSAHVLRHGRYQNFRLNGTAWTFSWTICVDPWDDELCYLVEITRVKFMEAQGAYDRPPAIQYLANYPFQSISGSKAMLWNFQCVKCLDKHVDQDDGRKSWGWEAEFQERVRKEWACLQRGGSFRGHCFGLDCPSVFKGDRPDLENSKLV